MLARHLKHRHSWIIAGCFRFGKGSFQKNCKVFFQALSASGRQLPCAPEAHCEQVDAVELLLDPQQVVLEESEQQVVLVSPLVQQQELSSWLQEQEQPHRLQQPQRFHQLQLFHQLQRRALQPFSQTMPQPTVRMQPPGQVVV